MSSSSAGSGVASTPASLRCCGGDRRRRRGQRVEAAAGLREGDDLADRVGAGQQHARCGPSRTRCRRAAARRRRTRRAGSRTSPGPPRAVRPMHLEDPLLHVARGGYGSTRRRSRCRCRRCRRRRPAPSRGRCRRCRANSALGEVNAWCTAVQAPPPTATSPLAVGVGGRLEQRRVDHPAERPGVLVDQAAAPADLQRGPHRAAPAPLLARAGGEEDRVAGLGADVRRPARPARSSERFLATGPPSVAVLADQHVRQPAGAALLGPVLPGVELLARLRRAAGLHDRADVRRLEHPERGVGEERRCSSISSMAEAQVGLVRAVAVHRVGVGDPRDRRGDLVRRSAATARRRSPRRAR